MKARWPAAALAVASLGCGSGSDGGEGPNAVDTTSVTADAQVEADRESPSTATTAPGGRDPRTDTLAAVADTSMPTQRSSPGVSAIDTGPPSATTVAILESHGYEPASANAAAATSSGLEVIVGRSVLAPQDRHQAFFFFGGRFVGTDLFESSRAIEVAWRSLDTIALAYDVYRPDDEICCPTGGAIIVRYSWDGKEIVPLDPVPSAEERR